MVNPFTKFFFKEEKSKQVESPTPKEPIRIAHQDVDIEKIKVIEFGTSGVQNYSGYIQEEYLSTLTGSKRAKVYDMMRRSDSNISMILNSMKGPIKSAEWNWQQGDKDTAEKYPYALDDMKFIEHVFSDMIWPFAKIIEESTTVLEFGLAPFERTHKIVMGHPVFGNYVGLKNIGWRSPKVIEKFNIDRDERLVSITQMSYGDSSRFVEIPAAYLSLITIGQEGANYEGVSILRPCYGNYYRKNEYQKLLAVGIEKNAIPIPIAKVPEGKEESAEQIALERFLDSYTANGKKYLVCPQGWDISLHPSSGFDPSKIDSVIDSEDKRMSKAVLANFLELGMGTGGSYSLSNDLSDFFLNALQYIGKLIALEWSKVAKEIIIMNFGPREVYPFLTCTGINDKAGLEFSNILVNLTNSNVIVPDDTLEADVREKYRLPAKSDLGQRPKQAASPFGFSENVLRDRMHSKRLGQAKLLNQRNKR